MSYAEGYRDGVAQGLDQGARIVEQLIDHYSQPEVRAALGLAMDTLRQASSADREKERGQ